MNEESESPLNENEAMKKKRRFKAIHFTEEDMSTVNVVLTDMDYDNHGYPLLPNGDVCQNCGCWGKT